MRNNAIHIHVVLVVIAITSLGLLTGSLALRSCSMVSELYVDDRVVETTDVVQPLKMATMGRQGLGISDIRHAYHYEVLAETWDVVSRIPAAKNMPDTSDPLLFMNVPKDEVPPLAVDLLRSRLPRVLGIDGTHRTVVIDITQSYRSTRPDGSYHVKFVACFHADGKSHGLVSAGHAELVEHPVVDVSILELHAEGVVPEDTLTLILEKRRRLD